MSYIPNQINDCNCGHPLSDDAGRKSIKTFYETANPSFADKLATNLPVAGVGAVAGLGIGILLKKFKVF